MSSTGSDRSAGDAGGAEHSGFDVIVVGAGAAGAALAARLVTEGGRRVLLLEAGPAPGSAEEYAADALDAATLTGADVGHPLNWAYPATLATGRAYSIARGRVLGGSTAINGGYFVRARRADFDGWVALGSPEWSYERSLPFLRQLEHDVEYGDTELHGASGPMFVTRPALAGRDEAGRPAHPVTAAFERAAVAAGFAVEVDKNGEQPEGIGPLPMNLHEGVRWNAALAYLLPPSGLAAGAAAAARLEVRGGTEVQRVVFEGARAVGVEVRDARGTSVLRAPEVVLAAGALATPVLLLRSGVGARAELEALGIECRVDSPGVGASFSDHPQVQLTWTPRASAHSAPVTAMESVLNVELEGAEIELLPLLRPMGVLLGHGREVGAEASVDLSVLVAVQNPGSRGRIRLASSDPDDAASIDFGYLEGPTGQADRTAMRTGVRLAARLLLSPEFGLADSIGIGLQVLSDDELLDAWIGENLGTALHTCGTAPMGPRGSAAAVVDQRGRVHGATGLRIADLSIVPTVPRRGPAATAVLVGERIAAFLLHDG